jgi:hypothetical protein
VAWNGWAALAKNISRIRGEFQTRFPLYQIETHSRRPEETGEPEGWQNMKGQL